jgi:DNA-nicking Smr family endonuclease
MKIDRQGEKLIVDIHGMRAEPAKFRLEATIAGCSNQIKEIVVIHGFNQGQVLKEMVRNELMSPRILGIAPCVNEGQTIIRLRRTK